MDDGVSDGTILVKVFADLRRFQKANLRLQVNGPTEITSVLKKLSIPAEKVTIIFVNGRHAVPDDPVSPGDTLSLFPPVGGG